MKITAVILLATCLHAAAAGYGQKVTISEKDAPVEKIFSLIRKQTGFQFLYANQVLAQARKVTIQVKNAELEDVLTTTFQGQPFDYHIKDKTIIVRMRAGPASMSATAESPEPPIDVRGRVVNEKGEPVEGATVLVQNTNKSTVTNENGDFVLNGVNENATLQISHVQYEVQNVYIAGKNVVNAIMQLKINSLDETVVIAYGTTTKRFNTGNVATVKAVDIEKQPVNNPILALQGRVTGLLITQANGLPGGGVTVRVQGQNSISKGNDPLYVIDGVPYISQLLPSISNTLLADAGNQAGSPLSFINPNDIESIEVLKDADATAIYGSRAANGAILITTKKGKIGKTKVDVNVQHGWGKVTRTVDLLNTEQYIEMRKEAKTNDNAAILNTDYDINGFWDTEKYTDWQKELLGKTAKYSNIYLGVSGGTATMQYLVGGTYYKETSVFPGDYSDKKAAVHFNVSGNSPNQKFKISLSGNYMVDKNQLPRNDLTSAALTLPPNAPDIFDENGAINWMTNAAGASTWNNPLAAGLYNTFKANTVNLISNATISYSILPGLDIKSNLGYTFQQGKEFNANPLIAVRPENKATSARIGIYGNSNINSWIVEPQISYNVSFKNAKVDFLVGSTIHQLNSVREQLTGRDYNSDYIIQDIRSAATVTVNSSINSVYKYNALFGRMNFRLANKYILNFTARRDGSSRFGSDNQFHNFGSVGAAWIFSEEPFITKNIHFLSFGKLKGSYGTTGNDQISDYSFLDQYTPITLNVGIPYQSTVGIGVNNLPNPYLEWEETRKLQFGVELGFFKDRALLNITFGNNRSGNQLLSYNLPLITGFQSVTRNFPAVVENRIWEFSLNTTNFKGQDFSWNTNVNLTIPRNRLVKFPDLETSTYANQLVIGKPVNISKVYRFLEVDPVTGGYLIEDSQGKPIFTSGQVADQLVVIDPNPQYYGGFENDFKFKGFELSFLFQFIKQIGSNYFLGNRPGTNSVNQPTTVLDRWQQPNDIASIQRYNSNGSFTNQYYNALSSDRSFSDASFIRLKNVSLSWQLPAEWRRKIRSQNVQLYVQGQNLLTITSYDGLDPENKSVISLPPLRMITAGAKISF